MKIIEDNDIHKGHRARMRRKFEEHGAEIFDTYELLEMMLYCTISAKDTNPMAKRLLSAFGSLEGVLSASADELTAVKGVGAKTAELIGAVGRLGRLAYMPSESQVSRFDDYYDVGEYFVKLFDSSRDYKSAILMLDNSMRSLDAKILYEGLDFQSAGVREEAFVSAALSAGASVVMIAHNHPYGPLFPTIGDTNTNSVIATALENVGVLLAEHYIVAGNEYKGFMHLMKKKFMQRPELANFYKTKMEAQGEL